MTDGAALPLALSDLVAGLRGAGLLDATVTAGHAFGGDLEAVTVPSALALAVHRQAADVVVVAMGPGVVGTGTDARHHRARRSRRSCTPHGRCGACRSPACGCPMPTSGARHQGVSHHTRTALEHTLVPVVVPLPPTVDPAELGATQHKVRTVEVPDVAALLEAAGLQVTTMGRGPDQEPRFFAACAAAGVVAADLLP